jgi:hypothetical protein
MLLTRLKPYLKASPLAFSFFFFLFTRYIHAHKPRKPNKIIIIAPLLFIFLLDLLLLLLLFNLQYLLLLLVKRCRTKTTERTIISIIITGASFLLTHFQNSRELVVDPRQTELLQPKEELLLCCHL